MSFSFQVQAKVGEDDVAEKVLEKMDDQIERAHQNNYQANEEMATSGAMIGQAARFAAEVVAEMAREGDTVSISVSGHGNPSKEPNPGWASNMISVHITQQYPKAD